MDVMIIFKYIVIAALGGLGGVMANRGIAVFNDGFRPIVPQYYDKQISRKELAAMSFAISFGLVVGFGIPTSIAASVILIHCIFLATDIIGTFCPDNLVGTIISGVIGAVWGVLILVGLDGIVFLFNQLPFNFMGDLGKVSDFVIAAFAIFPAVAIGFQHGFKKGVIIGVITVIVYMTIMLFGKIPLPDGNNVVLNPAGISLLVGCVFMIIFAVTAKHEKTSANADLVNVFGEKVSRIRKNWPMLAVTGGLIACAASMSILAGDPISMPLISQGEYANAALTALARAIGFVPLVFTTAIVTGVYGPAGCTFVFPIGIALTGNPILAFVCGVACMVVELLLINAFAKLMDKFPGIKDMGEHIRNAMNKVLEVALIVGAVVSAEAMASNFKLTGVGALFIIGTLLLNRTSKKPIVEMAVGPVACIFFGILLNILAACHVVG
ncbi:MAG: YhfT family protein [Coriobacteriia bacterium]|nr:YhfT family protein [Coriobacteriia bacterium]